MRTLQTEVDLVQYMKITLHAGMLDLCIHTGPSPLVDVLLEDVQIARSTDAQAHMMPCQMDHKLKLTDSVLKPKRTGKKNYDTAVRPKFVCLAFTWLITYLGAISTKPSCMPCARTHC